MMGMKVQYSEKVDAVVYGCDATESYTRADWLRLAYAALDQANAPNSVLETVDEELREEMHELEDGADWDAGKDDAQETSVHHTDLGALVNARTRIYGPSEELMALYIEGRGWLDPYGGTFCQRVRIDGEESEECSMVEFLDANLDALEDAEVMDLLTGGTVPMGGGAQPYVEVTGVRS